MTKPQVAFSLAIPPSWSELDLRPATRDRSIANIVQERYRDVPQLREHRADMAAYLRDTARAAWDVGCRYCGVFVEAADDGIVPGSVTVSILPTPPSTGGSALDDIVTQLHTIDTAHNTTYWTRTSTVTLKHAGDAARTWGIQPLQLSPRQDPVPIALMNTYVPLQGGVALVSAGSPAAEIADTLFDLFDAVTDTFRLHTLPEEDS